MHRSVGRSGPDVWSELLRIGYLSGKPYAMSISFQGVWEAHEKAERQLIEHVNRASTRVWKCAT
jgi:hypothetical protein